MFLDTYTRLQISMYKVVAVHLLHSLQYLTYHVSRLIKTKPMILQVSLQVAMLAILHRDEDRFDVFIPTKSLHKPAMILPYIFMSAKASRTELARELTF